MFIAHESKMNGASKSLLNLISFFKQYSEIFVVVSNNEGPFYEYLLKEKVHIIVQPFYRWSIYRTKRFLFDSIKYICKYSRINNASAKENSKDIN